VLEKFEDIKVVIINFNSKKEQQHNGQEKKDKPRPTKHYAEN